MFPGLRHTASGIQDPPTDKCEIAINRCPDIIVAARFAVPPTTHLTTSGPSLTITMHKAVRM